MVLCGKSIMHSLTCRQDSDAHLNHAAPHLQVQWLHENRMEGCTREAIDTAAGNGHLSVVQFLDKHRCEGCSTRAINQAALNGHLHVVKWLHANRKVNSLLTMV